MNWLTVKQAAAKTGFSESIIYAWVGEKRLRHIRVGKKDARGSIRIQFADLEEFVASLVVDPEVAVKPKPKLAGSFRHIDPAKAGRNRVTSSAC